jgi:hypothetical protein
LLLAVLDPFAREEQACLMPAFGTKLTKPLP